jgi:6-pyruvoyl-tetrahydropterin synthase
MHGHRWVVKAIFGPYTEEDLDAAGIALDFKVIKNLLEPSLALFDHQYLNNFVERPSAELIGLKILRDMQQLIESSTVYKKYVRLHAVEMYESPESCCRIEV